MSSNIDRMVEFAMTHRAGVQGAAVRCQRPKAVRDLAERMRRWTVSPEVCKSCQTLPAIRFTDARALCGRCHGHLQERRLTRPDDVGLRTVVTRADEVPTTDQRLEGYAIRFNEKSVELWGFFEVIRPAAADRLVAEKPDLRALWNHSSDEPLGRTSAGTLRAEKRTKGVWTEIDPPRWADRHVESIARRDVTGMSFGFTVLEDDWWLEEGMPHREVLDMNVIEFSAVSFPAYPTTSIKAVNAGQRSAMFLERQTAERLRMAR